jgi:Tfp pilus assembly PilM family ATPase/predicted  nucleic acid-binding Zn-ribbon protein
MTKKYTGSEIVSKIQQATELLEKGTPPGDIWKALNINRQTYNKWKEIYDPIQAAFDRKAMAASKKLATLDTQVTQLKDKLKKAQSEIRKLKKQCKAADEKAEVASELETQLAQANDRMTSTGNKVLQLQSQLRTAGDQQKENEELQNQLAQANDQLAATEETVRQLQSQLKTANAQGMDIEDLQAQLVQAHNAIVSADHRTQQLEAELASNEAKLQEFTQVQAEHREFQEELRRSTQHIDELRILREQLTRISNEKATLEDLVEELQIELGETKARLEREAKDHEELRSQFIKNQEKRLVMAAELDALKAKQAKLAASATREMVHPGEVGTPLEADPRQQETKPFDMAQGSKETVEPEKARQNRLDAMGNKLQEEGDRYRQIMEKEMGDDSLAEKTDKQNSWLNKLCQNARNFCYDQACPIGIDIEDECITLVQLSTSSDGMGLIDAKKLVGPHGVNLESDDWAKWAVNGLKEAVKGSKFRSRKVSLALPVRDTFIDHLTIPSSQSSDYPRAIFEQIQNKMPYKATFENTIIKYIPTENDHVLAIILERQRIEQYLAMCEKARLKPQVFSVWPMAMANCYSLLWTRKEDAFVMLYDVAMHYTNIVICHGTTLYYARTIPVGAHDLDKVYMVRKLAEQILASRAHFTELYGNRPIIRNLFFAGQAADRETITKIVRHTRIPAQLCDPFAVIKIANRDSEAVDAKKCRPCWSVAFGLSLEPKMDDAFDLQLLHI